MCLQGQVVQLQAGWDAAQQSFADLEGRMTSATQAATKIGNRLQVGGWVQVGGCKHERQDANVWRLCL